jgi:hypothetical protein
MSRVGIPTDDGVAVERGTTCSKRTVESNQEFIDQMVAEVPAIGGVRAARIARRLDGAETLRSLAKRSRDDLMTIISIGPKTADTVREWALKSKYTYATPESQKTTPDNILVLGGEKMNNLTEDNGTERVATVIGNQLGKIVDLDDDFCVGFDRTYGGRAVQHWVEHQWATTDRLNISAQRFAIQWEDHVCDAQLRAWNNATITHDGGSCPGCEFSAAACARDNRMAVWADAVVVLEDDDYLDRSLERIRRYDPTVVDLRGESVALESWTPTPKQTLSNTLDVEERTESKEEDGVMTSPGEVLEAGTVAEWKRKNDEETLNVDDEAVQEGETWYDREDEKQARKRSAGQGVGSKGFATK